MRLSLIALARARAGRSYVPEAKGKPARVNIYPYPNASGKPIAAKSFYKAQEVDIRWSPAGLAVLIFTHTDVDATGGSYYGSTGLFLLHSSVGSDGSAFDCAVPLPKEGPIGDAQWSPNGREFIVIAGARALPRGARLAARALRARRLRAPPPFPPYPRHPSHAALWLAIRRESGSGHALQPQGRACDVI